MQEQTQSWELLIGTYTNQEGGGIYLLDFYPATGKLADKRLVAETVNPSYLAISKNRQYVYTVNETKAGHISSFRWNEDRSQLIQVDQQPSQGNSPCYVDVNPEENLLALANYGSGSILVYNLDDHGMIGEDPVIHQHEGSGPVMPNQKAAHAHCVKFDPQGKYLYALDLGIDQIIGYPVVTNEIMGKATSILAFDPGDGPRHMIFHPLKDMAFVVNELSGSVVSLKVDHETGLLQRIDRASTLPKNFAGRNACADIHITANGKFLYVSNRGHDSIAIFSVSENGELESLGHEPVQGKWPRNFILSPDEKHLLVANQNSNNITVFELNPETGLLTFTGNEISVTRPVVMKF